MGSLPDRSRSDTFGLWGKIALSYVYPRQNGSIATWRRTEKCSLKLRELASSSGSERL